MQIDIVSDTVCPWCFIGKRRLEKALALRPQHKPEIRWRPYQLNPELPAQGMERTAYMAAKFGSEDRAREIFAAISEAGRGEGLEFAFDRVERAPNTLDSHRLIRWAGSAGCQDAVVEALFAAYFFEGRDISSSQVLVAIAEASGMDGDLVARLLAEGRDCELVAQEAAFARSLGVTGVPTFLFGNTYALAGAQDPHVLAQAMDKLAAVGSAQAKA